MFPRIPWYYKSLILFIGTLALMTLLPLVALSYDISQDAPIWLQILVYGWVLLTFIFVGSTMPKERH